MSDQFIGVDVGGTKIAIAVLEGGELSESRDRARPSRPRRRRWSSSSRRRSRARCARRTTRAVGIGMPSIIEFATGRILASVNIPLHDIPLRELLTERMGVPVYVENDAGCAALAEAFEDGRITVSHLVMFTIGTGVGGGWVLERAALPRARRRRPPRSGTRSSGATSSDGDDGPGDPFPQRGSLETLASGRALDRLADDAAGQLPGLLPRAAARARTATIDGHDVVDGAEAGDDASRYGACGCWASGSGSASPTRSTRSTRWRS